MYCKIMLSFINKLLILVFLGQEIYRQKKTIIRLTSENLTALAGLQERSEVHS